MNENVNQHSFNIRYVSEEEGGKVYEGQFTVKRLSIKDKSQLGVRRSQLCGGMYCVRDDNDKPTGQGIDEDTEFFNTMIAHLEIALIQKPIWFNLDQVSDASLIKEVYGKLIEFEMSFKSGGGRNKGSDGVRQENSSTQSEGTGSGNSTPKVVGKEVSASLDA